MIHLCHDCKCCLIASQGNVSERIKGSNTRMLQLSTLASVPRYDRVPLMLCQSVLIERHGGIMVLVLYVFLPKYFLHHCCHLTVLPSRGLVATSRILATLATYRRQLQLLCRPFTAALIEQLWQQLWCEGGQHTGIGHNLHSSGLTRITSAAPCPRVR